MTALARCKFGVVNDYGMKLAYITCRNIYMPAGAGISKKTTCVVTVGMRSYDWIYPD